MESVKHFDGKLLLKNDMNTEEGKRLAQVRHDCLEKFIDEITGEMNGER